MCCQSQIIRSESRITLWSKPWNNCWRGKLQHADTSYPQQTAAYIVQVPLPCDRYDTHTHTHTHIYICSHADKISSLQVNITTQIVQLRKTSVKNVIWQMLIWILMLNFLLRGKKEKGNSLKTAKYSLTSARFPHLRIRCTKILRQFQTTGFENMHFKIPSMNIILICWYTKCISFLRSLLAWHSCLLICVPEERKVSFSTQVYSQINPRLCARDRFWNPQWKI